MIEPDLLELRGFFSSNFDAELDLNMPPLCLLVLSSARYGYFTRVYFVFDFSDGLLASMFDHVAMTRSEFVIT